MTYGLYALIALAVVFAGFALWVRLAPTDATRWHRDPATAQDPSTPNFARLDRLTSLSPAQAAAAIAAQAESEGAVRLAGDDLYSTWIARTRIMRYPDFVSIRITPEGAGTRVVSFSRSRFGYGDGGVNRARLSRWIGRLPAPD
jgi:hypothetical protein